MVFDMYIQVLLILQIQLPGEPRDHHPGEVRKGTSNSKFVMDLISLSTNKILRFLTVDVEYPNK